MEGNAVRSPSRRPLSPSKFAHVVLRTRTRFDEMIAWYTVVLDARVVFKNDFLAFLGYDDEHHRIAIAHSPDALPREAQYVGLDHFAFTYDSLDDLLATYRRLKELDIKPFCCVDHGPTTSMYFHDPDRNRVELQIDNFADMEQATEYMKAVFLINPSGVLYDPEALIRRLAAGEPASALTKQQAEYVAPPDPELLRQLLSV
jgi:catechol-2,3-dioxygenase